MNKTNIHWGKQIQDLRKAKGFTQDELAHRSGVARSHIGKIEAGLVKTGNRETFERLANGLGMTYDQLSQSLTGEARYSAVTENPEQILERLRMVTPVRVPVVRDAPLHAGEPYDAFNEYVYLDRSRAARKGIEARLVIGNCLSPTIEERDIVILDKDLPAEIGDIVACFVRGELHFGRLRKIAGDTCIENSCGRFALEECTIVAPVIEVVRRLK